MKHASYRFGVEWIALNDNPGADTPDNSEAEANVACYTSTALLADLFNVSVGRVAKDVMRLRQRQEI